MKRKITKPIVIGITLLLGMVGGCTKERPFELLPKEQVEDKSIIDTSAQYIYTPSILDSPRTQSASRPQWQGQEKLVKLRFGQNALDIVELDSSGQFLENETNLKPVLSIPVEHIQYRCAKNSVGECSNKEELDNETPWQNRKNFKPDFGSTSVREVNPLPLELENLFSMGACFPEVGSRFVGYKLENDALNFQIERTFRASLACASGISSLSDLTFSVIHHYSLVKVSSIASKDYVPVVYPRKDENTFGFFTTDQRKVDEDGREREDGEVTLMNRFNPNRQKVTYYLNEPFKKAEYASVVKATQDAFATLNRGLEKAGATLRLELKQADSKLEGDIRNSMIVMVEDPQAYGLLGYGPTVANPLTGEIISGKTVMYMGGVKKTIRTTYEELRDEMGAAPAVNGGNPNPANPSGVLTAEALKQKIALIKTGRIKAGKEKASPTKKPTEKTPSVPSVARSRDLEGALKGDMAKILKDVKTYTAHSLSDSSLKSQIHTASKHCLFPSDSLDIKEETMAAIKTVLGDAPLKPWEQLSKSEQAQLLDILIPYVWTPILIHEMGHNLGLRHNFQGSEDKDNFYTEAELAAEGIKHAVPHSSVMEYAARSTNELRLLGKYDIAALRFGYKREVELKDGSLVKVDNSIEELTSKNAGVELRDFGFCTDEHVGINAGCKRFDEGTTYTEIATNLIKNYEWRYKLRNFRNNARSFSIFDDAAYAGAINDTFHHLRLFLEVIERIDTRFNVSDEQWETIPFLKDLRDAADIAGNFLMNVVTTPDILCAVQQVGTDGVEVVPLSMISKDEISCSGSEVSAALERAGYVLVAQAGKSFHSKKDPAANNPYADQIDVRGIWMDKLIASEFLLSRSLGMSNLDQYARNYLEYKDMGQKILNTLASVALDRVVDRPVEFKLVTGETVEIPMTFSLDMDNAQLMRQHPDESLQKALGLPQGDTLLSKALIRNAKKLLPHISHAATSKPFADALSVRSVPVGFAGSIDLSQVKSTVIGEQMIIATPANALAVEVIKLLDAVRVLSEIDQKDLTRIVTELTAGTPAAAGASPAELKARELGVDLITSFMNGELESASHYEVLLTEVLAQ